MADQTQDTGFLTARIDLQGLEKDLNSFKEKLDGWSDAIVRKTEAEKVQHVREMQKLSETIQQIQKEHDALSQQALVVRQQLEREDEEHEALKKAVEEIIARQESLPELIASVQEALDAESNALWRRKAKTESKEGEQSDFSRGLQKIIDAYSDRLGLTLSPTENGMDIVYTHIDRNNPTRKFKICVTCDDDDTSTYSVTSCQPPLNDMLQSDIDDLNATGDFSSFVMSVRRRFVDTCS
ncbi:hypothetical protein M9435_000215 [Picochlorum sp. BPE23]|nr:hypothetical protein M9435_000215 [Picochlorum sp. BPE23]